MPAAAIWNATAAREGGTVFSTANQCAQGVAVTSIMAWYTEPVPHSTWDYQQGTQDGELFLPRDGGVPPGISTWELTSLWLVLSSASIPHHTHTKT